MTRRLGNCSDEPSGYQPRHVLPELINSVFDIDKMLYFVAPAWWKPRRTANLSLGGSAITDSINGSVVRWVDDENHGKYFITDESDPTLLGSSLGWLLQPEAFRNAFLNAPWVKAVSPIRPGKELAAIRAELLAHNPNDPVKGRAEIMINDDNRVSSIVRPGAGRR